MLLVCLLYILFNGVTGIVVGMVIDILLYNVCEVVDVIIYFIDNFNVLLIDLMQYVKGLDFLIEVEIIILMVELEKIYCLGCGSIKMCVVWCKEGLDIVIIVLLY